MNSDHPEEAATKQNHARVYTRHGLDWSLKVNPRSGTWRGSLDRGAETSERKKDGERRHPRIYWALLWGSEEGQAQGREPKAGLPAGKQATSGFLRRRGAHGRQVKPTSSGSTEYAAEEGEKHRGPPPCGRKRYRVGGCEARRGHKAWQ